MEKAIHSTTAQICKDVAEPPHDLELKEPNPFRRYARLLLLAATAAFLVLATVILAMRLPEFQAEKKTVSPKTDHDLLHLLTQAVQDNQTISCPCQSQIMSWCKFTTFHIYITTDGQSISQVINYTLAEAGARLQDDICNARSELAITICMHILSPVMGMEDSRTYLPSANAFTRAELLYTEMVTRMDTNAYEAANAYTYLSENSTNSGLYNYSQNLAVLVRTMAFQFNISSSSSAGDFWNASAPTRKNGHLGFALGMDVSWEKYLESCNAGFCDVQYRVSMLNRVLRAMGQVGGITTVVSLSLQFLIWPALRIVLCFPAA